MWQFPSTAFTQNFPSCPDFSKNKEANPVISNVNAVYGILYDKSASEVKSNFRLFRFKTDGTLEILGVIQPPNENASIESIESANCTVTLNGDFIFKAIVIINGTSYIKNGKIKDLITLVPSTIVKPVYFNDPNSYVYRKPETELFIL